ncbi:hypothetical protein OTK49_03030 [Vibrio coralliirubri]|uniref:hypothetical protein n=1 Tax=Vibrio coralliirubri TaxID=1516159 RepID=UPI002283D5CE|nr:hypothetical protein [Vibrio coralliirubri]MCY9861489.1 hypothetical protein [Vibrio coralliirubri]
MKPLRLGEVKNVIHTYVEFKSLTPEYKEFVTETIDSIFMHIKTGYSEHTEETESKAYSISVDQMLASNGYTFDCFLYDNCLGLAFADMMSEHEQMRASLLSLYLVKHSSCTPREIYKLRYRGRNSIALSAEIYSGLGLGIHESGAWGGRKVVCSKDYPFGSLRQLSMKNVSNLRPMDFNKEQAQEELSKRLTSQKANP